MLSVIGVRATQPPPLAELQSAISAHVSLVRTSQGEFTLTQIKHAEAIATTISLSGTFRWRSGHWKVVCRKVVESRLRGASSGASVEDLQIEVIGSARLEYDQSNGRAVVQSVDASGGLGFEGLIFYGLETASPTGGPFSEIIAQTASGKAAFVGSNVVGGLFEYTFTLRRPDGTDRGIRTNYVDPTKQYFLVARNTYGASGALLDTSAISASLVDGV
jgi:hypothetical protein